MTPNEPSIAAMFDRIAPAYDRLNALLSFAQDRRWRKHLVRAIPAHTHTLLDLATGTGAVLSTLLKHRRPPPVLMGADISSKMLAIAAQRHPQVRFYTMSATALSLPLHSVDTITLAFGLRNIKDIPQALTQIRKTLTPGGSLLILEFFPPDRFPLKHLVSFYINTFIPALGRLLSPDPSAYRYLPASVAAFMHARDLITTLNRHGFKAHVHKRFLAGMVQIIAASPDAALPSALPQADPHLARSAPAPEPPNPLAP